MIRGTYKIIHVDGTESVIEQRPTLQAIRDAIGAYLMDTIGLDRVHDTVMFVDDDGVNKNLPVNPKATALYRTIAFTGQIHGDVAIVNDQDFA